MLTKKAPTVTRYLNLWRHLENPGAYLRWKSGLDRREPLEFVLRGGIRVRVPGKRLVEFKEIVCDDVYRRGFVPGTIRAAAAGRTTIVDIGANLGVFSLVSKALYPDATVIGIEPLPGNYAYFRRNLELNPGLGSSVVAVQAAVAAQAGTLRLHSHGGDEFPTDATLWSPAAAGGTVFDVEARTLPDILADHGLSHVSLLKLDCEGAEFEILYRAGREALERVAAIALEVHEGRGPDENIRALGPFLCRQGFTCSLSRRGDFIWAARDPRSLVRADLRP
jgi:FkbM family methyltransferase